MKRHHLALGTASALGIVAASVTAALAANRIADTPGSDLPLFIATLATTGWLGLAAGLAVQRWSSRLGFGSRMLIFTGLGIAVFVANMVIAASLMFISTHDLRLLLILCGYALAAAVIPALVLGRSLGQRLERVGRAADQIAAGDLTTRVGLTGGDDIARLAQAFDSMAARLEEADTRRDAMERSRRELFAAISHDLRTPLSSIRVMVEALSDGVVTDTATTDRYLSTMTADIERLSVLIDDLFELARIDSGALQLRLEQTAIDEVVAAAVAGALPSAELARVAVMFEPGTTATRLFADPQRLTRVLANLLQNAIRHTPPDGSVTVSTQSAGAEVLVTVADTGDGIPAEDVPHVFERFYRVDKSRSRIGGGSGLGLSISQGIIEAHGGRIWIAESSGDGTRVTFALPVA
ncbi:MAG: sensor histidine kinase [Dehalococcoidia bacterium]